VYRSTSIILAALTAITMSANAQPTSRDSVIVKSVVVHYGDLNLNTAQGSAILHDRIAQAASRVCGGSPVFSSNFQSAPLFVRDQFEQCRSTAINEAVATVRTRHSYAER
jgi:UrcA family protein